jgi:FKBP-type peptidyl-prolyl cis-trans isomerase FklB
MGMQFSDGLKMAPVKMDLNLVLTGLRDASMGKAALTDQQRDDILKIFEKEASERDAKASKERAAKNQKDGIAFLTENKKKEGVKITPSGLQYKVMTEGSGPSPKDDDLVTIHYKGTWIDGTVFDSSYLRKSPLRKLPLKNVIRGWSEGLQLMKVGAKYQLFIPADLGYGVRGADRAVPPNSTLIYEVELLSIDTSASK